MIRKYRKKPVVIEALQFDGTNSEEIELFTNGNARTIATHTPLMKVETLEGDMSVNVDDWVIKGIKGEFYRCKPDIFEMTYEEEIMPDIFV